MSKKPIERLYGFPFVLIMLLLLAKYVDLFLVPYWLMAGVIIWGIAPFFWEEIRERSKRNS
ncbi:hypothetical protein [Algoriphagus antarcticus]|uniref:Uncharacterized protein n=1 Tax=Algoriphagus antarcticus TaxID=238540 RepID=A0A3E0DHE1_9BACT|nr:hypothetical protein [Algoriphagus antarcticus]REG82088.1 hypothetical protein C8N25_12377 [Algoriphagus antarcticus]